MFYAISQYCETCRPFTFFVINTTSVLFTIFKENFEFWSDNLNFFQVFYVDKLFSDIFTMVFNFRYSFSICLQFYIVFCDIF